MEWIGRTIPWVGTRELMLDSEKWVIFEWQSGGTLGNGVKD